MTSCIVTGATGLVGRTLCRMLLGEGHNVIALGRNEQRLNELAELGADTRRVDISQSDWGTEFPEGVWFHCAAALTGAEQDLLEAVNIRGTQHVIEQCRRSNTQLLVFVSSIATYSISVNVPRKEDSPQEPYSPYGKSKVRAEQLVKKCGLPYVIVRPPFIGGPGDQNFLVEFSTRLENGKLPLISRNGKLGYVDARDLTRVMVAAMDNQKMWGKAINVQGQAIGFHEFVYLLSEKLGVDPPRHKIPYPVAYFAALVVELKNGLKGKSSNRGLSRYRVRTLASIRCLDTTLLHSLMDFEPIPIEKSLDDWLVSR